MAELDPQIKEAYVELQMIALRRLKDSLINGSFTERMAASKLLLPGIASRAGESDTDAELRRQMTELGSVFRGLLLGDTPVPDVTTPID